MHRSALHKFQPTFFYLGALQMMITLATKTSLAQMVCERRATITFNDIDTQKVHAARKRQAIATTGPSTAVPMDSLQMMSAGVTVMPMRSVDKMLWCPVRRAP